MSAPNRHFFPLVGMDADWQINLILIELRLPLGDCQVGLFDRALFKLLGKNLVGRIATGHHDYATGITIKPVHDARPGWSPCLREAFTICRNVMATLEVPLEPTGKSPLPVALGRVDHHTRGLVDNGHDLIDVEKLKRDLFRHRPPLGRLRHGKADRRPWFELEGAAGIYAIDPDSPFFNRPG